MITLPIEIGDTVLGGRFKNKKIIVREIGTDEHGSPTINGRSILKVRMPKLYMKENTMELTKQTHNKIGVIASQSDIKMLELRNFLSDEKINVDKFIQCVDDDKFTYKDVRLAVGGDPNNLYTQKLKKLCEHNLTTLEKIVRKIIKESLMERDITDPKVEKAIEDLNDMQAKLLEATAQMEALKEKLGIKDLEKQIKKLVDVELSGLLDEMKKDGDRIARTKNVILNVSKWHTERENYSYEKVLDFAMTQVNQDVKFKILEELKATQTITKVKGQLTFAPRTESVLKEENIFTKIGNWLSNIVSKLKLKGNKIDNNLDKLERIINKK